MDLAQQEPSQLARDYVGIALDSAAVLGKRTARLHLALASPTEDPAFTPETVAAADLQNLLAGIRKEAAHVLDLLKDSVAGLPDEFVDLAGLVLEVADGGAFSTAFRYEWTMARWASAFGFTATIILGRYCR